MNISKLSSWLLCAIFALAFASTSAWSGEDAPSKRGGPDGETHENMEEVETTGELVGEHDAVKKRGSADGEAHENMEEVETTGELVGEHDAPVKPSDGDTENTQGE